MSGYGISSTDIVSMLLLPPTPPLHISPAEALIEAHRVGHGLLMLGARKIMSN